MSRLYRIFDGYSIFFQDTPSDEYTTMLPTGFTDMNDNPIYESDILVVNGTRGVVEYDEFTFRFLVRFGSELVELTQGSVFSILGNAFDNPNLI